MSELARDFLRWQFCYLMHLLFAYQTGDWTVPNSVLLKTHIVMTGFPHTYSGDDLVSNLPEKYKVAVSHVSCHHVVQNQLNLRHSHQLSVLTIYSANVYTHTGWHALMDVGRVCYTTLLDTIPHDST